MDGFLAIALVVCHLNTLLRRSHVKKKIPTSLVTVLLYFSLMGKGYSQNDNGRWVIQIWNWASLCGLCLNQSIMGALISQGAFGNVSGNMPTVMTRWGSVAGPKWAEARCSTSCEAEDSLSKQRVIQFRMQYC